MDGKQRWKRKRKRTFSSATTGKSSEGTDATTMEDVLDASLSGVKGDVAAKLFPVKRDVAGVEDMRTMKQRCCPSEEE